MNCVLYIFAAGAASGMDMRYRTGLQLLQATVGVEADARSLLPTFPLKIDVPSLLTDFRDVAEIPFPKRPDGRIEVHDESGEAPGFSLENDVAVFRGPLRKLERGASDARYSLWGNQGFLYRFFLALLERHHAVYSFHACGLIDERTRRLYVVAGGPGSGKTVYLLSGIAKGLKLFSTETVHFQFARGGLTWFKGSLVDNVRLGTLIHDFPRFCPPALAGEKGEGVWGRKVALDLSRVQAARDTLLSPPVVLILPHIEEGRPGLTVTRIEDRRAAAKAVFDNISQKIAESFILDDRLAIPGMDTSALSAARLTVASLLVGHRTIESISSVLSNPAECWGDFIRSSP
jgi:hypothetical protein